MGKVGLGTLVALDFPACCGIVLDVAVTVFGALMERKVVFFCSEKGFGVSRGFGARVGLPSMELSIAESLKEGERR